MGAEDWYVQLNILLVHGWRLYALLAVLGLEVEEPEVEKRWSEKQGMCEIQSYGHQ